jgi:hypothetical protein
MASPKPIFAGSPRKSRPGTANASRHGGGIGMESAVDLDRSVDSRLREANRRGKTVRQRGLALTARYLPSRRMMRVELTSGIVLLVPTHLIQGLATAPRAARGNVQVVGRGYALYWPDLDLDVSVPALLAGSFGTRAWMSELARAAGRCTSPAKAKAARENGRKGGRPRKRPTPAARAAPP